MFCAWIKQTNSQLEWGKVGVNHSAYLGPVEIFFTGEQRSLRLCSKLEHSFHKPEQLRRSRETYAHTNGRFFLQATILCTSRGGNLEGPQWCICLHILFNGCRKFLPEEAEVCIQNTACNNWIPNNINSCSEREIIPTLYLSPCLWKMGKTKPGCIPGTA